VVLIKRNRAAKREHRHLRIYLSRETRTRFLSLTIAKTAATMRLLFTDVVYPSTGFRGHRKTVCCSNICRKELSGRKNYSTLFCSPRRWDSWNGEAGRIKSPWTISGQWYSSAVYNVSESSSPQETNNETLTFEERQKRRVYVGNIPYTVRWQEIKDHMREAGPVQYVHLFMDKMKRSKGSALVEYMTEEAAQKAIELLNNSVIAGRSLVVREDRGSIFPDGERKIYRLVFRHLSPEMRWQELRERCKPFGNIVRVLVRRSTTSDECHGLVFFPRLDQAQKAQEELNGVMWDGRQVECELEYDINDQNRAESQDENDTNP
jgi:RNA recognition motif-containing protein